MTMPPVKQTFNFGSFLSARSVMGTTIHELGQKHDNVWALVADTGGALAAFHKDFPDRFIDVGIAEQNCAGIAAGLALEGNIPFIAGMIPFMTMRACEQVRTEICYQDLPVRMIGTGGGLTSGGGSTHNAMEDIAIMKSMVNMTVLSIGDPNMIKDILYPEHDLSAPDVRPSGPGQAGPRAVRAGHQGVRASARDWSPARARMPPSLPTARWSSRRSKRPRLWPVKASMSASWTCTRSSPWTRN